MAQKDEWYEYFVSVETQPEWEALSSEGRRFISDMRDRLAGVGPQSAGNRQIVTSAFRRAFETVLSERGIELDKRPASIELVPGLSK